MKTKSIFFLLLALFAFTSLSTHDVHAKKKKKDKHSEYSNPRLENLSPQDKARFDFLTKEQQKLIEQGVIDKGFNEWMVELSIGRPFYATEHHPIYEDYEQVWLYTRSDTKVQTKEKNYLDPRSNWPTLHRITTKKTCQVNDFFILWDRGVVTSIKKAKDGGVQGSCRVTKEEAFLPIVDGRPLEPDEYIDPKSGKVKKRKKKK